MINAYICRQLTSFIDKSIIYQDPRKKSFLLYYLKNALTRFLFLLFDIIIVSKLETDILSTKC